MRGSLRFDVRMEECESAWSGVRDSGPSIAQIATRSLPDEWLLQDVPGTRRGTALERGARRRAGQPGWVGSAQGGPGSTFF